MKYQPIFLAALAALLLAGGCARPEAAKPAEPEQQEARAGEKGDKAAEEPGGAGIELSPEALKTAGVRTGAVVRRPIQSRIEVPGSVTIPGNGRAVVTPPVSGKIVRLLASVGDRVAKGQPLAVIQSGDLAEATSTIAAAQTSAAQAAAAVRQQASAVELSRGRLRTAQANLSRQRKLAEAGAFSQPSLISARNEVSEAQTEGAAARSDLAGARSRFERAERLSREGLVSRADYDQAKLDVDQAKIRGDRAEQRLTLAQETLDRETRIGRQGLNNAREIQTAEAEARAAKLELDSARVQLQGTKSAQAGAERAVANARSRATALRGGSGTGGGSTITLVAPIAGVVVERNGTLGQAVERATDLFDIEDAAVVWVTASVPESAIARIRPGADVTVVASAYPGRTFSGVVELIGSRLDPKTRTLPVQCRVANPNRLLRAELFAKIQIPTGGSVLALVVPSAAVSGEGDEEPAVFVAEEGGEKFERRAVKIGRVEGEFIEITEGLKEGDRIAVAGIFTLQSESKKDELKGDED